jgi:hypothetical protein
MAGTMPTREQDTTHGEIDALAWQRLRQLADDLKNQNIDSVAKLVTLVRPSHGSR